jgi:preprotein translocase subunit SecE
VARNRKRRRTRPPGTNPDPRQGLPTATHDFGAAGSAEDDPANGVAGPSEREPDNGAAELEPVDLRSDELDQDLGVDSAPDDEAPEPEEEDDRERSRQDYEEGAPPPLEHATPDVELAEEQLAYGRPDEPEPDDEADEEEYEREVEESIEQSGGGRRGGRRRRGGGYDGGGAARGSGGAGELATSGAAAPERAPNVFARLIGFLQGSWRELHRVQWPDRRQVFQATGVVIGFVIVAAVFLGVADWVSGKLVTFVLK